NTPSTTATFTASSTRTNTNTPSRTPTNTNTPSRTPTNTATFTPSRTPSSTPTNTPTATPTLVPTLPGGHFPAGSLLPAIANWLAPAVRGLFAMAPPPPPPIAPPCPGIPGLYGPPQCAPCPLDPTRSCAFVDANANGIIDPGEAGSSNPSYQQ